MSASRPIPPLPADMRTNLNMDLGDRQMAALDDNARFIIRRMVSEAYGKGFEHGWSAGQMDSRTDAQIRADAHSKVVSS